MGFNSGFKGLKISNFSLGWNGYCNGFV